MQKTDPKTKRIAIAIGAFLLALLAGAVVLFLVSQNRVKQVPDHFPRPEPRATSARAPWPPRFGVNANLVLGNGDGAWRRRQLGAIAANGLHWVRGTISGSVLQPEPGAPRFEVHDQWVLDLAAAGLEFVPNLTFTPRWAATLGNSDRTPANNPAVTDRLVRAIVRRYGPGGSLWREHPGVRSRPIRTWEIWNEENVRHFFAPRDGRTYAHHAVVVARAIRSVDPRARILFGGLAGHLDDSWQVKAADGFLADAIDAQPSLRRLLDGVAYHSYGTAGRVAEVTCAMRKKMDELGLANKPLVLNEFGAATSGGAGALDEQARATRMGETVAAVVKPQTCQRAPNVALIAPYTWWSPHTNPDDPEQWFWLANDHGTPLASGRTYVLAAAGADRAYPRSQVR